MAKSLPTVHAFLCRLSTTVDRFRRYPGNVMDVGVDDLGIGDEVTLHWDEIEGAFLPRFVKKASAR